MRYEPGSRVGAISHETEDAVYFFGYGVYEGDFPLTHDDIPSGAVAEMVRRHGGPVNPRIRLDNGKIVWGCECWWGPEDQMIEKYAYGQKQIIHLDIDEERAKNREPVEIEE